MSENYDSKARDFRTRAAVLRTVATDVAQPSRNVLLLCAQDYDRIAETIEKIIVQVRDKESAS